MNAFSSLHPVSAAFFFASVLTVTMFAANPFFSVFALLGSLLLLIKSTDRISLKGFGFYLVLFLMIALTNPLFSHNGVTPLFFLNGNPVTLEAVLYGVHLAVMLIAVVLWFKVFGEVLTSSKLLYLFGKLSPKVSLLISSALRFIPLLKNQSTKIRQTQKAMGLYASDSWTDKLKGTLRVYSALITWALENAVDTGSSMKARGYGAYKRSHYSLYNWRASDTFILLSAAVFDINIIISSAMGKLSFAFYPYLAPTPADFYSVSAVIAFALLCLLPFILEVKEDIAWKYLRSKI